MSQSLRSPLSFLAALAALTPCLHAHDGDPKLLDKQPMYVGPGWRNAQRRGPDGNLTDTQMGVIFPSSNVTCLAWISLTDFGVPPGGNGNSCFGYTSPSGREYAIMGLSNGTAFVEVTEPSNPTIVAQIAGPNSLWRDMRVYQHYCYAVSEGGGGIQVMNLANIDSGVVTFVGSVNDDVTPQTHTLAINTDSGYLYRAGGGNTIQQGLRVYNLNPNPAVPVRVGTYSSKYVHEAQIVSYTSGPQAGREIAYVCGGLDGGFTNTGLDVLDVTNKAAIGLLTAGTHYVYPNPGYCHQAWLSADRQFLYLNDELDESNSGIPTTTHVWNAANPANLVYLNSFTNNNTAIGHNIYTQGNLVFESNYRSGLHIFSTSNPGTPAAPVEIGYFDTYPTDDDPHFNGLWNNYPYFASGTVIGSDIEKGLFVWRLGPGLITFDLPTGEPPTISPAGQDLRVDVFESSPGVLVPGSVRMHLDSGSGFVVSDLVHLGGNQYEAEFPPTPCGTAISYYFTADSTDGTLWSDPQGAPTALYRALSATSIVVSASDSFETNLGWVSGAAGDNATTGLWTRVNPVGTSAQPENDHTAAGTMCWVTGQGAVGGNPGDQDVDGGHTTLVSATIDLSATTEPHIAYWRWYSNDQGGSPHEDVFTIDVSNNGGSSWVNVETVGPGGTEAVGGWIQHEFRVADLVAPTANVKLRFIADDSGSGSVVEAAIDDFQVSELDCGAVQAMCFGDGSGTSCPCSNDGSPGHGCQNSISTGGAILTSSGTPNLGADTLVLTSSGERPTALSIFLQGNLEIAAVPYGDGLRCAGGNLKRLYTRNASGGVVTAPIGADPTISARSAAAGDTIPALGTRLYQVYYRDPDPGFCTAPTGSTFNVSNGLRTIWAP